MIYACFDACLCFYRPPVGGSQVLRLMYEGLIGWRVASPEDQIDNYLEIVSVSAFYTLFLNIHQPLVKNPYNK